MSITIKNLNKIYPNGNHALKDVNLEIPTGMFGLLGPNGAGKSTLMRILVALMEPTSGQVEICGYDLMKQRKEIRGILGYLPQDFRFFAKYKTYEFLDYAARLSGMTQNRQRKQAVDEMLENVGLFDVRERYANKLSGGMKRRLGIAQALIHHPKVIIVDEPTTGLDPEERIRFRNLLVELSRNRIVIFSTHIIEDIASSCNQVGVINKGSLKYHGTPGEMVEIAKNVTWTFEIPAREFAKLPSDLLLVHHIRNGEYIKVRCLSEKQPVPNAVHTTPLLEDSYLWLLRSVKLANHEQIITQ